MTNERRRGGGGRKRRKEKRGVGSEGWGGKKKVWQDQPEKKNLQSRMKVEERRRALYKETIPKENGSWKGEGR